MARRSSSRIRRTAAAFVTVGVAPLIVAPSAHAEMFDMMAVGDGALFDQFVYTPLHTGLEAWIDSNLGRQIDGLINALLGSYVIGDGAAGTADNPNGGAGGWLFGDGGAGWNSTLAGVGGGAGGAAGFFGTGGAGGAGGAGAAGGAGGAGGVLLGIGGAGGDGTGGGNGGDGGDATGLFGIGGPGGNALDHAGVLPALGGAGGSAGLLGAHGAVGRFATLLGGAPPTLGFSTAGGWLTDGAGRAVVLHGLNEVYKVAPFEPSAGGFGDDDAAFLAANGFNAVRLGVIWAGVEPQPGVFDDAYLASIAQTVRILADHGIVTVLDMHQDSYSTVFGGEGAPEWATLTGGLPNPIFGFPVDYPLNPAENHAWDAFWSNAAAPDGVGLQNHYARMWEYVADHFKDDPAVAGYEVMNEPWPGSPWLATMFGGAAFDAQRLTPFYDQAVSAIRAVDPTTPVFFEPNTLFSQGVPTRLGAVDQPHTVFAFHDYCTFSGFGDGILCPLIDDTLTGNASAYARAHHIPAIITEFGSADGSKAIAGTMNAADRYGYGWLEWAYNGVPAVTGTSTAGALVFDPSRPPTGDNVDDARLATLAAPYPQLVAGTPNSWSFADGAFVLSYSTERADGLGGFAAGSQTVISVPALAFPRGYQVSVTGGQVVSGPNAPVLVIASDAGAAAVDVVVSAAAGG